ncbi:hypothetical protein Cgig2_026859 [Carnegiea gigantea]|uniref:Uncharacterized protein n=1 Tax=Carnegiea gigantea TaxID=171969 RepID=A0A9Q1QSV3_9CARY|nr:hypothetical protein Cgig2_026859 [Carnegiea gigantea]
MKRAKGSEGGVAVEMVGGVDQQSVLVMLRRGERGGVADHVVREATEGNTREGEEVDEAAVVEERIRRQGSTDILKEVFNRITYSPTRVEYGVAVEELRKYKPQLAAWVKRNEPERVEKKLRKTLANIGSVADVKLFNTALGKYGVLLMNNRSLVVNLAERKCSCK